MGHKLTKQDASKGGSISKRKTAEDLLRARELFRSHAEATIYKYFELDEQGLLEAQNHPKTPMNDRIVIALMLKALEHGDSVRYNFLLDRTIGKVVERVETTKPDGSADRALERSIAVIQALVDGKQPKDVIEITPAELNEVSEE